MKYGENILEHLAVLGYRDGSLRIYTLAGECLLNSQAHRSEITVIQCDKKVDAQYLFIGSTDTDITVFNLLSMEPMYALRGHKNAITGLTYIPQENVLISSSKDMLLKVWELDTQHCVQTLIDTQHEIWNIKMNPQMTRLLVGCTDPELRVLNLEPLTTAQANDEKKTYVYERMLEFMGPLYRQSKERVLGVEWDNAGETIAVFGASENVIEFFVKRTSQERERVLGKRMKKLEKQFEIKNKDYKPEPTYNNEESDSEDENDEEKELTPQQWLEREKELLEKSAELEFTPIPSLNLPHPVRSVAFSPFDHIQRDPESRTQFRLAVVTTANTLHEYDIRMDGKHKKILDLSQEGHSSAIRSVMISSEKSFVASASKNELKLWNYENGKSFRTVKVPKLLCSCLLPGEQYAAAGCQDGSLVIVDLNTSMIVERQETAHLKEIWSIQLTPDGKGLITGSSDQNIKLWELVVKKDEESEASFVGLEHEHSLQMTDDVQTAKISANGKFVAIALLDSTVKIFYLDSLKFFLSLYGHSLPVNALDMSSDEQIIATASSDKTIKIWGLDYGDCHKSLIGHSAAITDIKFVKDTHYFFSCSRDGSLKRWDADNYECIQVIRDISKNSPLTSLSISEDGALVVTGGHERALFVYEETDDMLFLEEEKEKRLEEELEKDLPKSQQFHTLTLQRAESTHATQRTIESIHDGERLIEALDVAIAEDRRWEEYTQTKKQGMLAKVPDENPLLMKMEVNDYVWFHLKKIRRSEIVNVLSVLGYSHATYIMSKIEALLSRQRIDIELAAKLVFTLVKIHQNTLFKDTNLFKMVYHLNLLIKQRLQTEKDHIGFNSSALKLVRRRLQNEKEMLGMSEITRREQLQYRTTNRRSNKAQEKIANEKKRMREEMDEAKEREKSSMPQDSTDIMERKAKRVKLALPEEKMRDDVFDQNVDRDSDEEEAINALVSRLAADDDEESTRHELNGEWVSLPLRDMN
eukprot:CAMPEP_0117435616 /NCGR_PEP_ID=MMETSP0759-20121206/574_1 /TAXON_ID=63605 /ORGANISM="Percolomonas cosmopolitus, Strain WS" /LENGTH=981 /DNA_ID=CAMNT_0005227171 /DNA_START=299 /DNA_END=3242 /DNA_ORIENTATION=-